MKHFEEEISAFTSLRLLENESQKQQTETSYSVEPLLIQDLLKIDDSNPKFVSAFNGLYKFIQCFIYGRVVGIDSKKLYVKYTIDDGTGCILVCVLRDYKNLEELKKLRLKVGSVKPMELKKALKRVLNISKKILDIFDVSPGVQILVLGRPCYFKNEISLFCDGLFVDDGIDRELEVMFKRTLIDSYTKRKRAKSNTK